MKRTAKLANKIYSGPVCSPKVHRQVAWNRPIVWTVVLVVNWFSAAPVMAMDGIKLAVGKGSDRVDALRISVQREWPYRWLHCDGWMFTGYWDVGLDHWNNEIKVARAFPENLTATHEIWVISGAPVFRWQRETPTAHGLLPFLEMGTGASIFSNRRLVSRGVEPRVFGIHFQFMTHIGAGIRFGEEQRFELKLRKYHYSNANIHHYNQGMDLLLLTYGYWF